jgi:hypothetical protein
VETQGFGEHDRALNAKALCFYVRLPCPMHALQATAYKRGKKDIFAYIICKSVVMVYDAWLASKERWIEPVRRLKPRNFT